MSNIFTVNLPDIGEGVVEAEVIEWLKEEGEELRQDEPVVVVMTDKATVELPAPYPGKLLKKYCLAGETALLDKPLYDIETEKVVEKKAGEKEKKKILATPKIRKMAKELNIDLEKVTGTGKEGMITEDDLRRFVSLDREMPIIGIKALMAEKMVESKKNIPHFSYFEQVLADNLVAKRQEWKKRFHLSYMPFFIEALSLTIERFPEINSSVTASSNKIVVHEQRNIGIAMSGPHGLIVPVLKNVENLSFEEIIERYNSLKERALKNELSPQDMRGSTITISNFGSLSSGGKWATPIINFPEATILALNRIQPSPIVREGQLAVAHTLNLSWSFDHRMIDGDLASRVSHYFALKLN